MYDSIEIRDLVYTGVSVSTKRYNLFENGEFG